MDIGYKEGTRRGATRYDESNITVFEMREGCIYWGDRGGWGEAHSRRPTDHDVLVLPRLRYKKAYTIFLFTENILCYSGIIRYHKYIQQSY